MRLCHKAMLFRKGSWAHSFFFFFFLNVALSWQQLTIQLPCEVWDKCSAHAAALSRRAERKKDTCSDQAWMVLSICVIGWNELWGPPADCHSELFYMETVPSVRERGTQGTLPSALLCKIPRRKLTPVHYEIDYIVVGLSWLLLYVTKYPQRMFKLHSTEITAI